MVNRYRRNRAGVRDEINRGGRLSSAHPLLISAARWIDVIREEKPGTAASAGAVR